MKEKELDGCLNNFTDRIVQRELFMDVYINEYLTHFKDPLYSKKIKTINYYGVGGAGKSSLLQKILSDLNNHYTTEGKRRKNPVYAYYNFEDGGVVTEVYDILLALVKSLKANYGNAFKFKRFEEAYKIFLNKQKSIQTNEEGSILDKYLGLKMADNALGIITGVSAFENAVTVAGIISSVGKSFSKFRKELQGADVRTLLYNMPLFFVEDMKENMEDAELPLVILLDTYEKYINTAENSEEITTRDQWLYQERNLFGEEGIIHQLPDVLWVIAGREELRWGVEEDGWIKKVEVENFDRQYTMEFLDNYKILHPEIREHIFETTKGNPFYLRICAAIHENITARNQEVRLEDFNPDNKGSKEILVERYVRYIRNEQQEEMIYRLSCFDGWDRRLLNYVINKELGTEIVLDKLLKFSFITCRKVLDGNGREHERYNMHQTMRNVIHTACPLRIKEDMHGRIREYYTEYLAKEDTFSFDYIHGLIVYLYDCLEFLSYQDCLEAFCSKVLPAFEKFWTALRHQAAYNIAEDFLNKITEKYPDTVLHAQALILFSDCTYKLGKVIAIKDYLEKAIRILEQNGHGDSMPALNARGKMIPYYISFKDYPTAVNYARRIYEQLKEQLTDKHPDTLLAEKRYALILRQQERNIDGTLLCVQHLTNVYQGLAEYYDAEDPQVIATAIDLLNTKRFLPDIDFLELFAEAEQLYEKCTAVLGEAHPVTVRAKGLTALYASLVKDFQLAINRQSENIKFYEKNLGFKHTITVNAMMDLANYYKQWNKPKDYERILSSIPVSGLMEQDRWPVLFFQTEQLINRHELASAKEIYTALLEEIRNNLQEGHIEILNYTSKLIHRLCKNNYYDEAIALFRTISHMDKADETLLKLIRVCDEPNNICDNYEDLCIKLETLIEEQSRQKEDTLLFWQCRQQLSNLLIKAKLTDKAYQLRQQLWNIELPELIKNTRYAESFRKQFNNLKALKNKKIDTMEKIKQYQTFYSFLKGRILQNCIRHKMIYTLMNTTAGEYLAAGKSNEVLLMKISMYNLVLSVFGPGDKTCRFIMSEMQRLVFEEGWRDWSIYLKSKKDLQEPVNYIMCKTCSRIRPITIEECSCS